MVYKELTINLYPYFWELDLNQQRAGLLHELVHTLIMDTKTIANDLLNGTAHTMNEIKEKNEEATSKITHLLDCLLQKKLDYARRAYKNYLKKS